MGCLDGCPPVGQEIWTTMKSHFLQLVREHVIIVLLIIILTPLTGITIASLFFSRDHEIVYEAYMMVSQCLQSGTPGQNCVGIYQVNIGNTGVHEESVRLSWPMDLAMWKTDWKIQNIAADEPRKHDPVVKCEMSDESGQCVIEQFAPGTFVEIQLVCYNCSGNEVSQLEELPVDVTSSSPVISRGNPKVSILVRRLQVMLSFVP